VPQYVVVTPLKNGGRETVSPGETVELSKEEGDALVSVGALTTPEVFARQRNLSDPLNDVRR
jgi:hypothetical protein